MAMEAMEAMEVQEVQEVQEMQEVQEVRKSFLIETATRAKSLRAGGYGCPLLRLRALFAPVAVSVRMHCKVPVDTPRPAPPPAYCPRSCL